MSVPTSLEGRSSGLRRSLSVWQAVGLSVALMAPSMAANINPQASALEVGRAVPLTFFLAAIGVLLVAYGFVRLCQYYQHAGSVYAFVGATLGPRTGFVSGVGLLGTYSFYGVVTASATGIFGTAFLQEIGVWPSPPAWAPFLLAGIAIVLALYLTVLPAKRGTGILLTVESVTVGLILVITAVVLVRILSGSAPGDASFDLSVFVPEPGSGGSAIFLGIVFGFLSFAGFEAAATLGEEAHNPHRDIPRAILGTAIFGGLYFTVVTAVEMMAFGTDSEGVAAFAASPSLLGDIGNSYLGSWVGAAVTLGAAISAFGCCLACTVGASRLLFALGRDVGGDKGIGGTSRAGTPANAAAVVSAMMALIIVVTVLFGAETFDTFLWSATIGTLLLLVIYVLTTIGAIRMVFVQRKMSVPSWQVVIPIAALVVLGYTIYRNVIPYPTEGAARWFPIVAGGWLLLAVLAVAAAPGVARRVGANLAAAEGLTLEEPTTTRPAESIPGSDVRG